MMKYSFCLVALLLFAFAAQAEETWPLVICHGNDVHGGVDSSEATFMNPEHPPQLGGAA